MNDAPPAGPVFPGQEPGEEIALVWREHWIRLVLPLLAAAGWTALTIISWFMPLLDPPLDDPTRHLIAVLVCVGLVYLHIRLAERAYKHFLRAIVLTGRKIHYVHKTLLTQDDARSIEFALLQNVRKHQRGGLPAILKYGDLILETAETSLVIRYVPRVNDVLALIMAAREKNRSAAPTPVEALEQVQQIAGQAVEAAKDEESAPAA